jgi:hypothetical protein
MAMIAPVPDASPERMVESQGPPVQSSVSVQIPRVQKRPELEDILTAPEKLGVAVADFLQRQPRDGVPSTEKTTAYLAYDQQNLYVSFRAEDSERHIRARMSKREDIADDDLVTVYLDTFHDGQRAYYFTVNPLGLQADGMISGTGGVDARFDTLWYSSGRVTDTGYIVQLQIPFKSLRFSSASDQTWGIALSRVVRGKNETSFWPYITQRQRSLVQQMGVAEGMHEITPTRNIQLIPYAAFTGAQLSNGFTPGYKTQTDKRGGMDGKIVLRNALTLDFTIKPDFSQVESNDPLVTINRRFEVFFPEKRPFFLDNQNFFETPIGLLFTRRIAAPDYGARLTGRVGRWSIGMLGMDDRAPGRLAVGSLAGRETGIGVIRILRDVGRDSNLGVFVGCAPTPVAHLVFLWPGSVQSGPPNGFFRPSAPAVGSRVYGESQPERAQSESFHQLRRLWPRFPGAAWICSARGCAAWHRRGQLPVPAAQRSGLRLRPHGLRWYELGSHWTVAG